MNVEPIIEEWDMLKSERSYWDSWWQELAKHVMPRKAYFTENTATPNGDHFDDVFDTTAVEACDGLASMMTSQLTPFNQRWMDWTPPVELQDDELAVRWFKRLGEAAVKYLASSNFYADIHEVNLDKAGFGTGALYLGTGNKRLYDFKHIDLGSYSFREDEEGQANELWREFKVTAAQYRQMFGEGAPMGAKMSACYGGASAGKRNEKFTVLHVVRPRAQYDSQKIDAENMPFQELYVVIEDKLLVQEGGYVTFPYMVSRFQKWGNEHVWGLCPARKAMPAINQANFLQEMMDELAELQVRPRFKYPADMVGEIDLRAGGGTPVRDGGQHQQLQEWMTSGRYDIGQVRIGEKQDAIKRMFFQSLWENVGQKDKAMTAEEVRAIRDQQTLAFVPAFNRMAADFLPLHRRMYAILLNAGIHDDIPQSVRQYIGDTGSLPEPTTVYNSQISIAIGRLQAAGFDSLVSRLANVAQLDPAVLDEFDLAAGMREVARVEGVAEKVIRKSEEVEQIQQAKAQASQQAEQAQAGMQMAEAAGKLPDDVIKQAMGGAE